MATHHCGTHAPGYLTGGHPTVAQGIVQRKVCFHWSNNNCRWSSIIRVRRCSSFYVYELSKPPACNLRYCGNNKQGNVICDLKCTLYQLPPYVYNAKKTRGFNIRCRCFSLLLVLPLKNHCVHEYLIHFVFQLQAHLVSYKPQSI